MVVERFDRTFNGMAVSGDMQVLRSEVSINLHISAGGLAMSGPKQTVVLGK